MANPIRPEDLPSVPALGASDAFIVDTGDGVYKATPAEIVVAGGADIALREDLADPGGSSLVDYDTGTVYDFLESIPRLGEDVVVTGNTTLGLDAFGRIHHVTATATLTFPNPGSSLNAGIIIVRPADTCTGLVTLSGAFVYGASSIILWAGEQIELEWYASGGYYRIRTYQKRLMGGKISNETGNIAMTDGVYVDFPVNTPSADRGAFDLGLAATPFYLDVANSRLKIPRTGQYHIEAICSISPAAACVGTLTLCRNGETQNLEAMTEQQFTTSGRRTITCSLETFLAAGDYIIPRLKTTGAAGTVDNSVNGYVTILEVK